MHARARKHAQHPLACTHKVGLALRPPSLLNTLIAMFMSPGVYEEEDRLFDGQEYLQLFLLVAALIAVSSMCAPLHAIAVSSMCALLDARVRLLGGGRMWTSW